jgi:hypothetical protein
LLLDGEPPFPTVCWGCTYEKEESDNPECMDKWKQLTEAFERHVESRKKLSDIGRETYKLFREIILCLFHEQGVFVNDDSWTAHGLMRHFLFHNESSSFKRWRMLVYTASIERRFVNEWFRLHHFFLKKPQSVITDLQKRLGDAKSCIFKNQQEVNRLARIQGQVENFTP